MHIDRSFKYADQLTFLQAVKRLKLPLLYLLFFFLSFYALAVPPYFDLRVWSTFSVFLIISIVYMIAMLEEYVLGDYSLAKGIIAVGISVIIVGIAYNNYSELLRVKAEYNERVSIISQAKDNDQKVVEISPITSSSKYSCFGSGDDIMENASAWQNVLMSRYYELDEVRAFSKE